MSMGESPSTFIRIAIEERIARLQGLPKRRTARLQSD
jgi:hypothetical protein